MFNNLEIDYELKKMILFVSQFKNTEVIFLTARSYYLYSYTKNWLIKNLDIIRPNLVMVMEANDKFPIVKLFSKTATQLTFIDDLTYGHEKGVVKFHHNLIVKILKIKGLTYIGLDKINLIKSGHINFHDFIKL